MSESTSDSATIAAPTLMGVWVFDPTSPNETDRNFLFAEGRVENIDVMATEIVLAGRGDPVVEYGEQTIVGLTVTVFIPFGESHDLEVDYWRTVVDNRRAICYRDNRKRLIFCAINDKLGVADGRAGTALSVGLRRVGHSPEVG